MKQASDLATEAALKDIRVSFGAPFHGEAQADIRSAIIEYLPLGCSVHVDTALNVTVQGGGPPPGADPDLIVLIDVHRVGVLMYSEHVCLSCLSRNVTSGYARPLLRHVVSGGHSGELLFPHDAARLNRLPTLIEQAHRSTVAWMDVLADQVHPSRFIPHAVCGDDCRVAQKRVQDSEETVIDLSEVSKRDTMSGDSLRLDEPPNVTNLVCAYAGPIKEEATTRTEIDTWSTVVRVESIRNANALITGGQAADKEESKLIARCEAIERLHVSLNPPPSQLRKDLYREMPKTAVHPRQLMFRRPHSEKELGDELLSAPMYWTQALAPSTGKKHWVPAQDVWFGVQPNPFVEATTNGCAVGASPVEAALHGLFELIERDQFLANWYLRRSCPRLDLEGLRSATARRARTYFDAETPYEVYAFDVRIDAPIPCVWVMAIDTETIASPERPRLKTIHATNSGVTYEEAVSSALEDLYWTSNVNAEFRQEAKENIRLAQAPSEVESIRDHAYRYGYENALDLMDFVPIHDDTISMEEAQHSCDFPVRDRYDLTAVLKQLSRRLEDIGCNVIVCDITRPVFESRNLYCASVMATQTFPLSFGYDHLRFEYTDRWRRLAENVDRVGVDPRAPHLKPHPLL